MPGTHPQNRWLGYARVSTYGQKIDLWRAAVLMIKRYGDSAPVESGKRADELANAGDDAGAAIWRRIEDAVDKLAITTPSGPVQ